MLSHIINVVYSVFREKLVKKVTRSPEWPKVEKEHLESQPFCAACGGKDRLQVHHQQPFRSDPALELDPHNLITLCMSTLECHLRIGHGGSFKQYNPNVVADCITLTLHPDQRSVIEKKAFDSRKPNEPGD